MTVLVIVALAIPALAIHHRPQQATKRAANAITRPHQEPAALAVVGTVERTASPGRPHPSAAAPVDADVVDVVTPLARSTLG